MAACQVCCREATHEVDEVWFDFGEPSMRFCSSKDLFADAPSPWMCEGCRKGEAHQLAMAVLDDAHGRGATGPLSPTRWWVRYVDGYVIGGDVMRASQAGQAQMDAAEYQGAVVACAFARSLLEPHDLEGVLAAIDHAESVGPILDPTLYRDKAKAMEEDKALVRAALALVKVGKR